MLRRNPVITGAGIVCAAGCGVAQVWNAVRGGRSGLGPLTLFASPRYGHHLVGQVPGNVDALAGQVRGSRSDKLAWIAGQEAFRSAGLAGGGGLRADRFGVVVGATTGGMLGTEGFLSRWLREQKHRFGPLRFHECASSTDLLARQLGARGPSATFSTACSAGAMALAAAAELIESGEVDVMLAGGCDSLCRLTLNGFGSLLLLDPNGCRPFDAGRTGISLGEGAALLLIEAEESAGSRGAPVLGRLTGWGASCDAFHATAPHPEGDGAFAAMRQALERAGLGAADIGYVSAHGTGTPDNDAMETKALRRLFGDHPPPVSSTMRFFGHTLAASGAIKAVLCVQALRDQAIPPNLGLEKTDPALGFEPVRAFQAQRLTHVLSNSFGFGGNNVALVFSHPESGRVGPGVPTAPLVLAGPSAPNGGLGTARPTSIEQPGSSTVTAGERSPPAPRLAILGMGIVSAAGNTPAEIQKTFQSGGVASSWFEVPSAWPPGRVPVFACGEFGAEQLLDAAKRRRLSRIQQMVLAAARRSVSPGGMAGRARDRICVSFGTGLGSLNDTAAFVENLIVKEERSPRPLFFTNSVHNALASQVALELGLTGLNLTAAHGETSFEAAIWHGARELRAGRAELALVGAADELNHYALAADLRWGGWGESRSEVRPFGSDGSGRWRVPAGEGCAVFALATSAGRAEALAWISAIRTGRVAGKRDGSLDAEAEAEWLRETLEREGGSLSDVDLVLTGANGWPPGDGQYLAVADAVSRKLGREMPCGAFKQHCGEFPAASAFGFATAVALVRGELLSSQCGVHPGSGAGRSCRRVVLYTISRSGTKGMCCVSA